MSTPSPEGSWITESADPRLGVLWPGADDYGDDLEFPLRVSAIQCADFAPELPVGADIPDNWAAAQVLQARALVRAGVVGSGDQLGGYGEAVTVYPMDWQVKNLLRPRRGRPYFGGNAHPAGAGS